MQNRWSHTRVCGWQRGVKPYQIPQLHDRMTKIWVMKCCSLAELPGNLTFTSFYPPIFSGTAVPHTAVERVLIRWLFLTKASDSKRRQFSKRKHADMSFITVRSLTSGISLLPCALHVPFVFHALWHARLSSSGCVSRTALPGSPANVALFSFTPSEADRFTNTQVWFFIFSRSLLCNTKYVTTQLIVCVCFLVMWFFTLFK